MENYHLMRATRKFAPFVDNLSNWYIRRSRKRFWKSENDTDKNEAYATLHYVLVELSKTIAPFAPFLADEIYKNLTNEESVHLADFPMADDSLIDEAVNKDMASVREIIKIGLQLRAKNQMKVRQPLSKLVISTTLTDADDTLSHAELINIIKEELNVKNVSVGDVGDNSNFAWDDKEEIGLNLEITPELKAEGQAREIIRAIQQMRKEADYQLDDRIKVSYVGFNEIFSSKELNALIIKETLADTLSSEKLSSADLEKTVSIDNDDLTLALKR
jgi:isoleucyl-tRNA synthetase